MVSKLRKRSTDREIDTESGEVLSEKVDTYLVESDTEFYITYCKVLGLMKDMGESEIKTLAWLVSHLQFNNNVLSVSRGIKKMIAEEMGISEYSIANALMGLVKKNILYRNPNGSARDATYFVHPEYFWKGDMKERKRKLKYVLELVVEKSNEDGRGEKQT